MSESEPIDLNNDQNNEGLEDCFEASNEEDSKVNIDNKHTAAGYVTSKSDDAINKTDDIKENFKSDVDTSSSESESSNIVKKNIETLTEVSKVEKIVSWMNSK